MQNKAVEILIYLLGYLAENNFEYDALSDFSEQLVMNGYSEQDIAEAVGLLMDRYNTVPVTSTDLSEQSTNAIRMLSGHERLVIPTRVYGQLLSLRSNGILNPVQLEKTLDYCMYLGTDRLVEYDINEIVANVLFEEHLS
jgi:uncharacterized protein Smg (DUF494 family)